jgi:hypothetical protein
MIVALVSPDENQKVDLTRWSSFVTQDDMMAAAADYEAVLNR